MLAPLLMGTLGKQKREQNLDANGLDSFTSTLASNFLGGNTNTSNMMNLVTNMLYTNNDGSIVDDVLKMDSSLFILKRSYFFLP